MANTSAHLPMSSPGSMTTVAVMLECGLRDDASAKRVLAKVLASFPR